VASAHTLTGHESFLSQLGHQLLGLHHLPLTTILIVGGIILLQQLHRNKRRDNRRPQ
jgi:hypothetical protein